MKTVIFSLIFFVFETPAFCQVVASCEVIPPALMGKYEGACSNKKAHGLGKAAGIDTYEGKFKKGYPDGEGIYTWQNGNFYTGSFNKGQLHGKGEMHYKKKDLPDSIITGYWKNDKYIGKYPYPYEFINIPSCVSSKTVINANSQGQSIFVQFETGIFGTANVRDYEIRQGVFGTEVKGVSTQRMESTTFQNVQFPFRILFNINATNLGNQQIEIVFYEPGDWKFQLSL